ncbi:MAG: winged helix-turn-helix transcriptional regulator [Epsilonproteobacteria bacterium]|nr:winged helix-turn-helix transcriptional regulator [Campylobacterota bacterium]
MQRLMTIAKIFSDKNRLDIFALLLRDKELCVCEICDTLNLSQPLVSRHLKQMREANILTTTQKKQWVYYSIFTRLDPILQCWEKEISANFSSLPNLIVCKKK